jgi:voltage-gated potassium channel
MREFLVFCRYFFQLLYFVRGVTLTLVLVLCCCAVAMSYADGIRLGDALYFTFITGLTIGYGDITPTTISGRVLSVVTGVIGVIFVGIIVAVATRALSFAFKGETARDKKKE